MPEKPIPPVSPQSSASVSRADGEFQASIDALLKARLPDPFSLLGPHPVKDGWAVRFFIPWADEANLAFNNSAKVTDAVKLRPEGFFEATWPSSQTAAPEPGSYKIQGRTHEGVPFEIYDPYSFPYLLSDFDLHLMGEGRHYDTYEKLGSPDPCNDNRSLYLQAPGSTAEEMDSSAKQVDHPSPFFLHGLKGDRCVFIETENRLVHQGNVCPASFLHPNRITSAVGVI